MVMAIERNYMQEANPEINPHLFFGKMRAILSDPHAILPRDDKEGTITTFMREVLPIVDALGFQQTFPAKTKAKLTDYFTNIDEVYTNPKLPLDVYAKQNGVTKTALEVRLYKALRLLAQELPQNRKGMYYNIFDGMFPNLIKLVDNTYYDPVNVAARREAAKTQAEKSIIKQEDKKDADVALNEKQKAILEDIYYRFFHPNEVETCYARNYLRRRGVREDLIDDILDLTMIRIVQHLVHGHAISDIYQQQEGFVFQTIINTRTDLMRKQRRQPASSLDLVIAKEEYNSEGEGGDDTYPSLGLQDEKLEKALEFLRNNYPDQYQVFMLRCQEDLPIEDIARLLGKSYRAVAPSITRAKHNLRKAYQQAANE